MRQRPADNIAFVPTAAMLAGDFTAFTSPQCNGGRQITLRRAVRGQPDRSGALQPGRVELREAASHVDRSVRPDHVRGRGPTATRSRRSAGSTTSLAPTTPSSAGTWSARFTQPPGYAGGDDSILKTNVSGVDDMRPLDDLGATTVFGSSMVNALRFAVNKAKVDNYQTPFFSPRDIGANIYSYCPGYMALTVTGGFQIYSGTNTKALFFNDTYQMADDLTLVRGNHQFGFGGNVQYWKGDYTSTSRANGNWIFDGRATGLGLADLLVGRVTTRRARRSRQAARQQLVHRRRTRRIRGARRAA